MHSPIGSEDALRALVAPLQSPYTLYLDCEFVRERTFWPQLALVQVAVADAVWLVDPLPLARDGALPALIRGAELTVMHSPSEDLECLLHAFDCLPSRLFDTQLAAAFCGLGTGLSYRALVEQFCALSLDKAETRSNWLARPLSESQLRYAAEDVLHLPAVHRALHERLQDNGRRAWFEADCAAQLDKARDAHAGPATVSLDPRQRQRLTPLAAARLRRILEWREHEARRSDRPRAWLLDNETAHRLATATPGDVDAHQRAFQPGGRFARKAPDALWTALQDCVADPVDRVLALDETVRRRRVAQLQEEVAACAEDHGLPAALLFPRRLVEAVVDASGWPAQLDGWRAGLLKHRIEARLRAAEAS